MKLNSDEVKEKQKNLSSKKKKKKSSLAVRIIKWVLLSLLSILCIIGCLGFGMVVGIAKSTPALEDITVVPTMYPTTILDANGKEIIQLSAASAKRAEASLDEIPDTLKWAFIDLEDERFYEHNGIDVRGIARAAYQTVFEGSSQGGSTLTQQLIKNNAFETGGFERSTGSLIRRKIQEQILALGLEKQMSKDEILINYMNTINLGGGNYGVKIAAQYYFNKDVSQLDIAECAVIAAITQNPSGNNPARFPEKNRKRMETCLLNMKNNGHITQAQYDEAMAEDVYEGVSENAISHGNSLYSYFIDSLVDALINDLQTKGGYSYAQAYNMVYTGGLTVYSTQDPVIQEIVDREINNDYNYPYESSYGISWDLTIKRADGTNEFFNQKSITRYMEDVKEYYNFYDGTLERWTYKNDYSTKEEADAAIAEFKEYIAKPGDEITYENVFYTIQPQMSFTVMDYTNGQVKAICGGRGEKTQNLTLNRAVDTTRQPGSCFKVLAAYAPALDAAGYTLGTAIDDAPFSYGGGKDVHNWWGDSYRGLNTVRDGIRDSMNVLAVKTIYDIGVDLSMQYLQNFGFTTLDPVNDAGLATALGGITKGITNLEINAAYGAIANKGVYVEPILYTKIVGMDGTVILDNQPETHTVLKESTASLLTSAMVDVVAYGTGTPGQLWTTPVAGKTGTTSDDKDLWFCAFIPNGLVASIWSGYDDSLSIWWGGGYHEALWATIMGQVVEAKGLEGGWFEMTGGIYQTTICRKSGKLPNDSCGGDPEGNCVISEYFAEGTGPSGSCDVHTSVKVCEESKLLPTEYCPEVTDLVCRVRPMDILGTEARGTTADSEYAPPKEKCNIHDAEWESKSREEESRRQEEQSETESEDESETESEEESDEDDE